MTSAIDPSSRGQDWSGRNGRGDIRRSGPSVDPGQLRAAAEQETAQLTQFSSVDLLLDKAHQCNQQVPTDVEFKRLDRAYIEWLKGDKILSLLYKHSQFPYLPAPRKDRYLTCRKKHESQRSMFEEIQDILQLKQLDGGPQYRPPSSGWEASRPSSQQSNGAAPPPYVDPLIERFSKLRTQTASAPRLPYPVNEDAMRIPSGASSTRNSVGSQLSNTHDPQSPRTDRPSGPRDMPLKQSPGPPHPPKEPQIPPLNTNFPRAPPPVYSPARNIPAPASVNPPRMTARSTASASTTPARPPQSSSPQLVKYNGSYGQPSSSQAPAIPEKPRPPLPHVTKILPQDLFQFFKRGYRVLVIDVRARELFDEGHIHTSNIVCIDPLVLRHGTSFEELIEGLVLSPDSERDLLEQIGRFDLVIYYDETTTSDAFLEGSPKSSSSLQLRALYDTLVEFNEKLPLSQRPVLLSGGLNGWMDLVGPHALQTSNTMGLPSSRRLPKPSRPVRRISIANNNSSSQIQKRRVEQLRHLTIEERKEFMRLNQSEQVSEPSFNEASSDVASESGQLSADMIKTYDDFFRRFPSVEQQSMVSAKPASQLPPRGPPPVPQIPSRPPPTVSRPSYGGVSERDSGQGSLTRQSGNQPPLYVSRIVSHAYKLPRTGLKNFAATCYMNATIQCLLATTPLLAFFLNDGYRASVQKNPIGSDGIMPEVFANLLRGLWRNVDATVRPITLQKLGGRLRTDFQDVGRQQDAKEYLDFLIDTLHEDLNINFQRTKLRELTEQEEETRERMEISRASKIEWDRWQHCNASPISHFFQGQHASRLRCLACGATSTTYETFMSIAVEIPADGQTTLTACLREYTKEEELDEGEEWRCPRCRVPRPATKRIMLTRFPQVLCIHLKRFVRVGADLRKIFTAVDFPLRQLDMSPFATNAQLAPEADGSVDFAVTPPFFYEPYAVMRHHGSTLSSGHYTAVCRDKFKGVWVNFNDESVKDIANPSRLQDSDAYILFYERSRLR